MFEVPPANHVVSNDRGGEAQGLPTNIFGQPQPIQTVKVNGKDLTMDEFMALYNNDKSVTSDGCVCD
jgi:hypothetical protein